MKFSIIVLNQHFHCKMELNGCGRDKGCFRYCDTRPKCPPEEAKFMVAIETEDSNENLDGNEVLMKIGGYLNENKTVKIL